MSLEHLLNPSSIAIVGASRTPTKIGHIVTKNLQDAGYAGDLFPINPKADQILGLQVYTEIHELPVVPDLCILSIPAPIVLQELQEAIAFGCKQYIVFTAGFKESGEEGTRIEKEMQHIAQKAGVTLLGPNCLGCIHTPSKLNATFAQAPMQLGTMQCVSQSGAVASALFDRSMSTGVGFESCLTLGNKTTLQEHHLLEYRARQEKSSYAPIVAYLESITDGQRFIQATKNITQHRPLLLLKPGKSTAAAHAMQSHTGSIAGQDNVLQAVCEQYNITRCHNLQELFDTSMYFSWMQAPKGNRIAIVTNAGGPGVISTDLIEEAGLTLAQLSEKTKEYLQQQLPRAASVADPIDVLGDAQADRYTSVLETIIDDEAEVDAVLILLTPQIMTQVEQTAKVIAEISAAHDMPIVCAFIGQYHVHAGKEYLWQHSIPCYDYPVDAITVLAKAYTRQQGRHIIYPHSGGDDSLSFDCGMPAGLLDTQTTQEIMSICGITTPQSFVGDTIDEISDAVQRIGYPLVMKLVGPQLLHKIDTGGVIIDIEHEDDLRIHYDKLVLHKAMLEDEGQEVHIQIQQQISDGVECIVGYKQDDVFGATIMFGAGGTFTELFSAHQLRILPISRGQIQEMIEMSSIFPLLNGYRGKAVADIESLIDIIEGFIMLVQTLPHLATAEINPIIVNEEGAWAVDPKIVLG